MNRIPETWAKAFSIPAIPGTGLCRRPAHLTEQSIFSPAPFSQATSCQALQGRKQHRDRFPPDTASLDCSAPPSAKPHHAKCHNAEGGIEAVSNQTEFHQITPHPHSPTSKSGKSPAQDHKHRIACNHNLRRRGCKRPLEGSERQNCPRNKEHNSTDYG